MSGAEEQGEGEDSLPVPPPSLPWSVVPAMVGDGDEGKKDRGLFSAARS